MPHRIITNRADFDSFTRFLWSLKLPVTVEWVQGRDRTREQNALQWMWAAEVAAQLQDRDADDQQDTWRLEHGVPILRRDSMEFREMYDACLKPLPYDMKKKALRHLGVKVTSAMKVPQMIEYLDRIERECREMGVKLTPPDPDLAKYHARYRRKDAA